MGGRPVPTIQLTAVPTGSQSQVPEPAALRPPKTTDSTQSVADLQTAAASISPWPKAGIRRPTGLWPSPVIRGGRESPNPRSHFRSADQIGSQQVTWRRPTGTGGGFEPEALAVVSWNSRWSTSEHAPAITDQQASVQRWRTGALRACRATGPSRPSSHGAHSASVAHRSFGREKEAAL